MNHYSHCGLYYMSHDPRYQMPYLQRQYLPQVKVKAKTTILANTSRTTLSQHFVNPDSAKAIREAKYTFPLYDGISAVAFTCHVGNRVITGEVHGREKAKNIYDDAVGRGEQAGLLEQSLDASDVFTTSLGNIPPSATVIVDITYIGELKHDSEVNGVRFTIPTAIAPRYGTYPMQLLHGTSSVQPTGFQVTVDIDLDSKSFIKEIRSPSHPITMSLGTTSDSTDDEHKPNRASATLSIENALLDKDFILQIIAAQPPVPTAILESHPTIPNHRALMATLVPRFTLKPQRPEMVFVCDRSGSMAGSNITTLKAALKVFLKSLPIGVKFNICSFGFHHTFLWPKSQSYSKTSLEEAMSHIDTFDADYGGTEMLSAVQDTFARRYKDLSLEVFLVTDGEIWQQEHLFALVRSEVKKCPVRVFTLGIGNGVSHALIEGVARAGDGFSQSVGYGEKLDAKVVRMLKAALSPHIDDYTLSLDYGDGCVEPIEKAMTIENADENPGDTKEKASGQVKQIIPLFDRNAEPDRNVDGADGSSQGLGSLPELVKPSILQAPHDIPALYAFNRTSVYLLFSEKSRQQTPKFVILRATSPDGPLELKIPVEALEKPSDTVHKLAAKKAMQDLEEGCGWMNEVRYTSGSFLKDEHESKFSDLVEAECINLGTKFQVAGKWCSLVAVEKKRSEYEDHGDDQDYDFLDDAPQHATLPDRTSSSNPAALSNAPMSAVPASAGMMIQNQGPMHMQRQAVGSSGMQFPPQQLQQMQQQLMLLQQQPSHRLLFARQVSSQDKTNPGGVQPVSVAVIDQLTAKPLGADRGEGITMAARACIGGSAPRKQMASRSAPLDGSSKKKRRCSKPTMRGDGTVHAKQEPQSMRTPSSGNSDASSLGSDVLDSFDFDAFVNQTHPPAPAPHGPTYMPASSSGAALQPSLMSHGHLNVPDPLSILVELQTFEGCWELSETLLSACGVDPARAEANFTAKQKLFSKASQHAWATAVAIAYLEGKIPSERDTWELLVDKAKAWLEENLKDAQAMQELMNVAIGLVG